MKRVLILTCSILFFSQCKTIKMQEPTMTEIDIQGHRGCRGLLPENTIPAFIHALDLGVHTLELDVVVSKDEVVVVSHEPFFNHEIASDKEGNRITKKDEKSFNMFEMDFEEIMKYDVGLVDHPKFKQQRKMAVNKPALGQMIEEAEEHAKKTKRAAPLYNIEIKRRKDMDGKFHPEYTRFTDLVMAVIHSEGIAERTTVQCFDPEVLRYLKATYPAQRQVYLEANNNSIEKNLRVLGHVPDVYSPYFKKVDIHLVNYCKRNKMLLIPWTINEVKDMEEMIRLGVDGIITDYPDRLIKILKK